MATCTTLRQALLAWMLQETWTQHYSLNALFQNMLTPSDAFRLRILSNFDTLFPEGQTLYEWTAILFTQASIASMSSYMNVFSTQPENLKSILPLDLSNVTCMLELRTLWNHVLFATNVSPLFTHLQLQNVSIDQFVKWIVAVFEATTSSSIDNGSNEKAYQYEMKEQARQDSKDLWKKIGPQQWEQWKQRVRFNENVTK